MQTSGLKEENIIERERLEGCEKMVESIVSTKRFSSIAKLSDSKSITASKSMGYSICQMICQKTKKIVHIMGIIEEDSY